MPKIHEALILIIGAAVFLCVLGFEILLELVVYLPFGWIVFLTRVLPQMQPDYGALAMGSFCLVALLIGGHRFASWLYGQLATRAADVDSPVWHLRWTGALVALVVLLFVSGICTIGIAHQTVWLLSSPEVFKPTSIDISMFMGPPKEPKTKHVPDP